MQADGGKLLAEERNVSPVCRGILPVKQAGLGEYERTSACAVDVRACFELLANPREQVAVEGSKRLPVLQHHIRDEDDIRRRNVGWPGLRDDRDTREELHR